MSLLFSYTIVAATLFAVIQIIIAHPLKPGDQIAFIDYIYDNQPDLVEYDQSTNYDNIIDDKIIKSNIRDILEHHKLNTNLKNYKKTRHYGRNKIQSPDYLNDRPYTSLHFTYHDDIIEDTNAEDLETDEHVKKLFHAIENNELLELYVECAKFSRLKEQYYRNHGPNGKKRFNRRVFDEIDTFCEFIKIDDDDFIM